MASNYWIEKKRIRMGIPRIANLLADVKIPNSSHI